MNRVLNPIKRIWNYCNNITKLMIQKVITGTGKLATGTSIIFIKIISVVMFIILISGLMLTAAGISFFDISTTRGSPPNEVQTEGGQPIT